MPTLAITEDREYFYRDSGAPNESSYKTLIIVHGHTFHSGIFERLFPLAKSRALRLICVNRRAYPDTTPYTPEELSIMNNGSEDERVELFQKLGVELALFVASVIDKCQLPKDGEIGFVSWSLGNIFGLCFLSAIDRVPEDIRNTIQKHVKTIILWDPPSAALGTLAPEVAWEPPVFDESIPLEQRNAAFVVWVSGYWNHQNLASHDFAQINCRDHVSDSGLKPTIVSLAESQALVSVADPTAGDKGENILVWDFYRKIIHKIARKAFLDPKIREMWSNAKFWNILCTMSPWNIVHGTWVLQDLMKERGDVENPMKFKQIENANHFAMWDDPEKAIAALDECIKG
ncbi:hypothetical protein M422DRAFT_166044 [Sphaerobolus stellatus SS14]|uniref:Unplaced genomic scaffold SPHSTscaffold_35, whole genome shotgun sequence n=1 Tax=Sphaerobolus stellatus (strain SS14) TaxID=990650 RepID=A0A0C9W3Z6_SPHS4|nr:hypothetical protein M422DRAFT_166044 [Sphaerobolus stellatus SS14]